jgi:hypothetical protein
MQPARYRPPVVKVLLSGRVDKHPNTWTITRNITHAFGDLVVVRSPSHHQQHKDRNSPVFFIARETPVLARVRGLCLLSATLSQPRFWGHFRHIFLSVLCFALEQSRGPIEQ